MTMRTLPPSGPAWQVPWWLVAAGKQALLALSTAVAQVGAKIPGDAWEYQIRKSLNDAAYNGLDYVPYCSLMPIPKETDEAHFMWVSAVGASRIALVP